MGTTGSEPNNALTVVLTQLETTERELIALHAEAVVSKADIVARVDRLAGELATTREAIAVLRRGTGPVPRVALDSRSVALSRSTVAPSLIPARLTSGKHGQQAAHAREGVVLGLMLAGASTTAALRLAVPVPRDATAQQHRQSIQNALSRMKGKALIVAAGEGWALTAKGRKAAAAAAKEAP